MSALYFVGSAAFVVELGVMSLGPRRNVAESVRTKLEPQPVPGIAVVEKPVDNRPGPTPPVPGKPEVPRPTPPIRQPSNPASDDKLTPRPNNPVVVIDATPAQPQPSAAERPASTARDEDRTQTHTGTGAAKPAGRDSGRQTPANNGSVIIGAPALPPPIVQSPQRLVFEAEKPVRATRFERGKSEHASGGYYTKTADIEDSADAETPASIEYELTTEVAATYTMRVRAYAPDADNAAFAFSVDGAEPQLAHVRVSENFGWTVLKTERDENPTTLVLSAGKHTLRIQDSANDLLLDRFWLEPQAAQ